VTSFFIVTLVTTLIATYYNKFFNTLVNPPHPPTPSPRREGEYKTDSQKLSPSLLGEGLGRGKNRELVILLNLKQNEFQMGQ
jgi:hypothetical protein